MAKLSKWSFKRHFVLSVSITLVISIIDMILSDGTGILSLSGLARLWSDFSSHDVSSIGIIGGADGPTVIYLTGSPLSAFIIPKIILLMFLLILYRPTKKYFERNLIN